MKIFTTLAVVITLTFASFEAKAECSPRLTPLPLLDDGVYSLAVDISTGAFDAYDGRGNWHQLTLATTLAPKPWFTIGASTGFARGIYTAGMVPGPTGERAPSGLTDSTIDLTFRLWRHSKKHLAFGMGIGAELPSGDAQMRIGGGHHSLTGRVFFAARLSKRLALNVEAAFSGAIPTDADADHAHQESATEAHLHGSLMNPHAEMDISGRIGIVYEVGIGWVRGQVEATHSLKAPKAFGPLSAGLDVGIRLDANRLQLVAGVEVPVVGLMPSLWVTRAGLLYRFGQNGAEESKEPPKPKSEPKPEGKPEPKPPGCGCSGE